MSGRRGSPEGPRSVLARPPAASAAGRRARRCRAPCKALTISSASPVPSAAVEQPGRAACPAPRACLRRVAGDGYLSQDRMSSSSQSHDAASSHSAAAAAPASRNAAVSPGSAPAQPLRSTSPVYRHVFRGPNHASRRSRYQDSPYRATSAASPPACAGVTHSAMNGRISMSAMPGSSSPAAVRSAGSSSPGPGALQNGVMDSAAARRVDQVPGVDLGSQLGQRPRGRRLRSGREGMLPRPHYDRGSPVPAVHRVAVVPHVPGVLGVIRLQVRRRGWTRTPACPARTARYGSPPRHPGPPVQGQLGVNDVRGIQRRGPAAPARYPRSL